MYLFVFFCLISKRICFRPCVGVKDYMDGEGNWKDFFKYKKEELDTNDKIEMREGARDD